MVNAKGPEILRLRLRMISLPMSFWGVRSTKKNPRQKWNA